jgi:carbamoyltransferase
VSGKRRAPLAQFLWLLYSTFIYYLYYLGFKVNSGENKVVGLAPNGEPKYVQLIQREVVMGDGGSGRC